MTNRTNTSTLHTHTHTHTQAKFKMSYVRFLTQEIPRIRLGDYGQLAKTMLMTVEYGDDMDAPE
jgi:hypothetical protein